MISLKGKRAAIYARYSSDLQKPTSIDDQLMLCREHAQKLGLDVVEAYTDPALSGASLLQRPGILQLLRDAKARRFDLVIAEAQDRLSRSLKDIADIYERLTAAGITITTAAEGEITDLHVAFKGGMNAMFLKDMAKKVRRGQRGQVERGRSPGGLAYGYRVVRKFGGDGKPIAGLREIDPERGPIVQRVFAEFISGRSTWDIAEGLNRDGIPAPRGGKWNRSTISGNAGRGNGILNNRLYLGEIIYGRATFRKDPETGGYLESKVPEAEWARNVDPALQIIDEESWKAVEAVRRSHRLTAKAAQPQLHNRPKRLLSGLVCCGQCGASYIVIDPTRMGCAGQKEGRGCTNKRRIAIVKLESRILEGLAKQLLDPASVARCVHDHHEAERTNRTDEISAAARRTRNLRDVEVKIGRLVDAIAAGADVPQLRSALLELEAQRERLQAEEAEAKALTVVRLQPHLTERYRAAVAEFAGMLNRSPTSPIAETARRRMHQLMRSLIERIVLHPTAERGGFKIQIDGDLAPILLLAGIGGIEPVEEVGSALVRKAVFTMVTPRGLTRNPLMAASKIWLDF
jgi:DNA invertase Pin-like site-specific DNA recombinase